MPRFNRKALLCLTILLVTTVVIYTVTQIPRLGDKKLAFQTKRINETQTTGAEVRSQTQTQSPRKIEPTKSTRRYSELSRYTTECPKLGLPLLDGYFDHWQNVSTDSNQFVFSAYVDNTIIRLIGASYREGNHPKEMFCQIWHKRVDEESISERSVIQTPVITKSTLEIIPEHHKKRYAAAFFKCPFPKNIVPYAVSLVTGNRCQNPVNHIVIAEPPTKRFKFTVCVKSIHSNFSDVHMLVQFIELNRLLGAESFTFYDKDIGSNVRKVLAMYINQGIAELISWKILLQRDDIHDFGLLGCLNECLYRKRQTAEYIVFVDLDEFIIPRKPKHKTWKDILEALPYKGAYIFRNTFFQMSWPNSKIAIHSGDDSVERYQLSTLLKFDRESKIFVSGERSKLIVRADAVDTVGNHFVWKMRKQWQSMTVDPSVALNQHYRYRPGYEIQNKTRDLTMLKYRDDLIEEVAKSWQRITDQSGKTQDKTNS